MNPSEAQMCARVPAVRHSGGRDEVTQSFRDKGSPFLSAATGCSPAARARGVRDAGATRDVAVPRPIKAADSDRGLGARAPCSKGLTNRRRSPPTASRAEGSPRLRSTKGRPGRGHRRGLSKPSAAGRRRASPVPSCCGLFPAFCRNCSAVC